MKYIEKIFTALGTLNTIKIFYNEDEWQDFKKILNYIEEYINEIDNKFSVYKETSELGKVKSSECIDCFKCVDTCNTKALYSIQKKLFQELLQQ